MSRSAFEIAMDRATGKLPPLRADDERPRSGERVLWCSTCGRTELAEPNIVVRYCPNCKRPMAVKPFTFTR